MELEWISCEDKLPITGERVLFCLASNWFVGEGYINEKGVWYRINDYPLNKVFAEQVSKWMPMPKG